MTLVTEENAVRAIAIMVERTVRIEVDELLLPEDYSDKLGVPRPVNEDEDSHETGAELDNETIQEKQKTRVPAKPVSGTKEIVEHNLGPTGKALHKLVNSPTPVPTVWLTIP